MMWLFRSSYFKDKTDKIFGADAASLSVEKLKIVRLDWDGFGDYI